MKKQFKLVVDLDDTISFCYDRDFANAAPNIELINKINKLFDQGWDIEILTARGQLSCDGDSEAAREKYWTQITEWLHKNGVKYHCLSFHKPLATFYVDDKALRPDEFVAMDIRVLKGISGAQVLKVNDKVLKTCDNALEVAKWYKDAKELGLLVPEVHSVIGKQLSLEYIEEQSYHYVLKAVMACKEIDSYKHVPTPHCDWSQYIQRLLKHAALLDDTVMRHNLFLIINEAVGYYKVMEDYASFCHGDYSVDNLIHRDGRVVMIDPIPMTGYSSYLLDLSKLTVSMIRFDTDLESVPRKAYPKGLEKEMQFLEMSHWLRMVRYLPNPTIAKEQLRGYIDQNS
jgi:capsule biosynthesis phosphatase